MNEPNASAIVDALTESARNLWFGMMLARYGSYASAQEMQAAARESADAIAAAMKLPPIADLLYSELNDIVDMLALDRARPDTRHIQ